MKAIQAEKSRRARDDFDAWLPLVTPNWTWDWPHLKYMRAQLARVTSGDLRYLMMFCPPRHGKTEQNSVRYAAYRIERDPSCRVILAMYNLKLAKKFSRRIQRIVQDRVPMDPLQQAVEDWATAAGGGVRAAGINSGVTGAGANLIIIDDPIKSRAEANSQAYRDRCWDFFTDDLFTRQEPGCAVCLTLTRWHEADLAGAIKASDIGSDWTEVNLPALAEENDPLGRKPGEALCPERYDVDELLRRKRLMKSNFYALFQGQPRPAEGNKYQKSWFRYWTHPKDSPDLLRLARDDGRTRTVKLSDCRIFASADLAVSQKTQADWTVFGVWAVTPDSDLVLLDLYRDQISEPAIIDLAHRIWLRWRPDYLAVGANGIGHPIIQNLRRGTVNDEGVKRPGIAVRAINEATDKVAKSTTAVVRVESGQVFFPVQAPWLTDFENELLSFPNGNKDDQCDMVAFAAEEVFWGGGSGIEDDIAKEARQAEEAKATEEAEREHYDVDNDQWWDR